MPAEHEQPHSPPDVPPIPTTPEPPNHDADAKYTTNSTRLAADVADIIKTAKINEHLAPGEYIIRALEVTIANNTLATVLHPRGTVGGSLFARRAVVGDSPADPKTVAVAIRLYPEDFAQIDELVRQFAAGSRPKLINAAVRAYVAQLEETE